MLLHFDERAKFYFLNTIRRLNELMTTFLKKLEKRDLGSMIHWFITAKTETGDRRNSSRNPGVPSTPEAYFIMDESLEIFARKVFVGGLPIDVTEGEEEFFLNWEFQNKIKKFVSYY